MDRSVAYFGPWYGEFGWELFGFQAWCRRESKKYNKSYVCSFPGMAPLYEDFAEFIPHNHSGRALDWRDITKIAYTLPNDVTCHVKPFKRFLHCKDQDFIQYGTDKPIRDFRYLIHPRNLLKGTSKNYRLALWEDVVRDLDGPVASVGREPDWHIEGTTDLRGISLDQLMRYMAGCGCVIGQSSGVMHLATLCGAKIVVWADDRTYFGRTLNERYKEIWNPFGTEVEYISHPEWTPDPREVIHRVLGRGGAVMEVEDKATEGDIVEIKVSPVMGETIRRAIASGRWLMTVSFMDPVEKGTVHHGYQTVDFPDEEMVPVLEHLKLDIYEKEVAPKKGPKVYAPATLPAKQQLPDQKEKDQQAGGWE